MEMLNTSLSQNTAIINRMEIGTINIMEIETINLMEIEETKPM